jgi:hypothetical protein
MMSGKGKEPAIREIMDILWTLPIGDYLTSEDFSRFCREHALGDDWNEYLQLSMDRPDLYGPAVIKDAFSHFLGHLFHSRQNEFLHLFGLLLAAFRRRMTCGLPLDKLERELLLLGYPEQEIRKIFRHPGRERTAAPEDRGSCSQAGKT